MQAGNAKKWWGVNREGEKRLENDENATFEQGSKNVYGYAGRVVKIIQANFTTSPRRNPARIWNVRMLRNN